MDRGQIVWQGDGDDIDAAEISARYLGVTR
jgi:hypothetical protein